MGILSACLGGGRQVAQADISNLAGKLLGAPPQGKARTLEALQAFQEKIKEVLTGLGQTKVQFPQGFGASDQKTAAQNLPKLREYLSNLYAGYGKEIKKIQAEQLLGATMAAVGKELHASLPAAPTRRHA